MRPRQRSTPAGEHRPVLLEEILTHLRPGPGEVLADCTIGWGGHAVAMLGRAGASGRLIGLDLDADNLTKARERLQAAGFPFRLHHANFAGLPAVLAGEGLTSVDVL